MTTMNSRMTRHLGILLLIGSGLVHGQDDAPITTGPPPGTDATPVMAYAPVGPRAGEEFDAAAAIGAGPGALLFIHELTRNGLPVIRGLDQIGAEYALLGFKSHTFLLSDDRTASETKLKAVNGSLKLRNPIVLSLDGMDGPGNYALNRKAVLSLVMLKNGKVHESVAFTDVNAEDAKRVRELIAAVAGELPRDPAAVREMAEEAIPEDPKALRKLAINQAVELQRLRTEVSRLKEQAMGARMQGPGRAPNPAMRGSQPPNPTPGGGPPAPERPRGRPQRPPLETSDTPSPPKREGKPPEDAELNALLRAFIRKDNDEASVDRIFADIEARAGKSDALKSETIGMFKLMLSFRDRYGIPEAQALAEKFLDEAK